MNNELISEINQILKLLESRLPGSMSRKENLALERNFRKSLEDFFLYMAERFPYSELEKVYRTTVKEVDVPALASEWDEWLDDVIKVFEGSLTARVVAHLGEIYIAGSVQMMSYGVTKLGFVQPFEGPPISAAVNWARDYGANLVTQMDEETKARLAQVISDGIENKRGIEELSRDLRKEFTDMSKARADMIAQTETNQALSQAAFDKMEEIGVDGKEWIVVGDDRVCEICMGNAQDGVIPLHQAFSSGDMKTPGHVNCRCGISPARLDQK